MRVIREETFGPILTVERFRSRGRGDRARQRHRVRPVRRRSGRATPGAPSGSPRALRHGTVWINDYGPYVPAAEWGGMKRSGNGRELGPTGLAEYQEHKHIWHNTAPAPAVVRG